MQVVGGLEGEGAWRGKFIFSVKFCRCCNNRPNTRDFGSERVNDGLIVDYCQFFALVGGRFCVERIRICVSRVKLQVSRLAALIVIDH
jgi:hypothetical protein